MPTTVTKTVKPSGGDYTSLAAWEAGEQADLVALDQIREAECYAMEDGACTIDGFTLDATRYVRVYTPATERHAGVWNASKYRMRHTSTLLTIIDTHVRVEGLQVDLNANANNQRGIRSTITGASDVRIESCLVRSTPQGTTGHIGIEGPGATSDNLKVRNCIAYDFDAAGFTRGTNALTGYLYNLTVHNCGVGISVGTGGNVRAKNCRATACATPFSGTYHADSRNNLTDGTGAPGANSLDGATVAYVDAAGKDFHLATGDAGIDAGVDLSADAVWPFSDDVDGETRSGTWDIGADEVVVAAATPLPRRLHIHGVPLTADV